MGVFDPTNTETETITAETLVGDGRKYADVNELAKAYANADAFIRQLKEENTGIREDLNARLNVEEQLNRFVEQRQNTPTTESPAARIANPAPVVAEPGIKQEDVTALVRQTLNQEREAETALRHASEIETRLLAVFGSESAANQAVVQKAEELGVSVDFLQTVALKSPKAFFSTLGLENTSTPVNNTFSKPDVNSSAFIRQHENAKAPVGSYQYYEEVRKSDPKTYWLPKTQNQMHADRNRLGDDFWKGRSSAA